METAVDATLTSTEVHKIPSNAMGPLISQDSVVGGLLLGRSSAGVKGLLVVPGVIDADYTGRVYIMAYAICPALFVPKGSRIAQIVALNNPLCHSPESESYHGDQGFGSTGPAVCFTTRMDHRPTMNIGLSQNNLSKQIVAMLDTGADITIINKSIWLVCWPVELPTSSITGIGGQSTPYVSKHPVCLHFPERQEVSLKIYVLQLPGTLEALTGRDVLSQIGAVLTTNHF